MSLRRWRELTIGEKKTRDGMSIDLEKSPALCYNYFMEVSHGQEV